MKKEHVMVANRWSEFKTVDKSAYNAFVLMYNNYSAEEEAYPYGVYESCIVFDSFESAEEMIICQLESMTVFDGLRVTRVDYLDGRFIYYAFNEDKTNWTTFAIYPTRVLH